MELNHRTKYLLNLIKKAYYFYFLLEKLLMEFKIKRYLNTCDYYTKN